jgi:peptidoglycan/xylan/chitin deacetylase (PgdA/CDA1 family)
MIGRCLKLIVSAVVLLFDQLCFGVGWLIGRKLPGSCTVINYHVVSEDFAERFLRQMRALVKLAEPISAVKNRDLLPGRSYIAVTVDDAFSSFALNAWPVLRELQIPVTVFVPTSYLGRQSAWVDYGGDNPVGEDVICAKTLLDIAVDELVDVGSHTATHADLVSLSDEAVRQELNASRQALETMLGRTIDSISFPYGSFGDRELRLAKEAGYRYQFSVLPRVSLSVFREGLIGRVSVQAIDWPIEFRLKVLGAYRWLGAASDLKHRIRAATCRRSQLLSRRS